MYFDFGSIAKKVAASRSWAESLIFPLFTVNNLFKFSAQGKDLTPFFGNGTRMSSEIKPPLAQIFWTTNRHYQFVVFHTGII